MSQKRTPIRLKADTLDKEVGKFSQRRLRQSVFLNSIPKSGSHLVKNVMRMFVPLEDVYGKHFIQWGNLREHLRAFDPRKPQLSWGHLMFSDASAAHTAHARKIILVRDPYSWVLARARFYVSDQFGDNSSVIKQSGMSADHLINLMIFGIHQQALPMREMYNMTAIAWRGPNATWIRYEDLVHAVKNVDTPAGEAFFSKLIELAGIGPLPDDWRERVKIGSDREQSGTARENLRDIKIEIPDKLSDEHKEMIDYAAPGLRKILGYK
ncbi:hypothetical protein [Alteraurantiacibacter aquimixticola]|uniref:Sulfotransferase domain-containing protein n=1 Tax=Alteraurantiacibacter aquimixticola TaxID=2489173 RepID=A0A4T3F4N8_9SPHN|nr:hypothetical protein [Alteraurantiacibacter aquimixticola]TIX51314.1 hypothetical protein E5222_02290 [Alteraurantiacibacter aquimixticola]